MVGPKDVFDQCHQHLRIIEQRRDIAVGVLFTLVLAVSALLVKDNAPQKELKLTVIAIAIGVFALLGSLRRWKHIHLHAASVFMRTSGEDLPTRGEAKAIWNGVVRDRASRDKLSALRRLLGAVGRKTEILLKSIDLWVLLISAFVSGVIAVPVFANWLDGSAGLVGFKIPPWLEWIVAAAAWIAIAFVTSCFTGARDRSFPHYAWMFQGLSDLPPDREGTP